MLLRTFKFGASAIFAIISFLIVIIAGLLTGVRFFTIFWRSLLAFFVAGLLSYVIVFILEYRKVINFDVTDAEEEIAEVEENSESDGENEEDADKENTDENSNEDDGFQPMISDNMERVAS